MQTIGLIGLGNVGSGFAKRLRDSGYPLAVFDIDKERVRAAQERGAVSLDSPGQVADQCDIVLLSLPGSHIVEAIMDAPDGIVAHLRPGHLIIDTGTSRPATAVQYAAVCASHEAGFLDAPITGRSDGWIVMVGGDRDLFEKARSVLECLCYKLKHVGPIGMGQRLKLINQLMQACQWAAWGEVITLTEKLDLDPRLLRDYLEFPVPEVMFGSDFSSGGTLALHYKDLGYLLEVAHEVDANIPLCSLIHEFFKAAKVAGKADWGQPGVIEYWRKLNRQGGQ